MRTNRLSGWGLVALATALLSAASTGGCRVSEADVQRWESTEHGPDKLVAVMAHDKYEPTLRVEAALALVRMKPRGGRRMGIQMMVDALASLPPEPRQALIEGMLPVLTDEILKPAPVLEPGQPVTPDTSVPYKDAAFAMLSYDKDRIVLIADQDQRKKLTDALIRWCSTDFEHRYDNASQMFGLEQVVRFIGPPAVRPLAGLITPDSRKLTDFAKLIAENGDAAAKEEASKKLVAVAEATAAQTWLDRMKSVVEDANRAAKLAPTADQLKAQILQAQDEAMERVFGAMKRVGGRAVVEYCLKYAADKNHAESRRVRAIAALEGNFDQKNQADISKILSIAASDETPDKVRDVAFARIGEMSRDKVIGKLYENFSAKKWQVRWVAAQTVLKMSTTTQIPEFMNKLPPAANSNFALTEALSYGDWMGNTRTMPEKEGKTARAQLTPYFKDSNPVARTTALGYFYTYGTHDDLGTLAAFESDRTPIPKCDASQKDCEWKCFVPKEGGKPDEKEGKEIGTVGDYVKYCILPAVKERKK